MTLLYHFLPQESITHPKAMPLRRSSPIPAASGVTDMLYEFRKERKWKLFPQ